VLVASHERPPLALVALANPVTLVGRAINVERQDRCDCELGQIKIERVIRDDSKLGLAEKGNVDVIATAGTLEKLDKTGVWVLRTDDAQRSVTGFYQAPSDGLTEVETALRSVAIEFERGPTPLPPLGIVTTRDGRVIWHRSGRVALIANLSPSERTAADALLQTFGNLGAQETPISASYEKNAWRLRIAGTGVTADAAVARSAAEGFAERVEARLGLERDLWRSAAVVVGKRGASGDAGGSELVVEKVLKNRSGETLEPKERVRLDAADVPAQKDVFLLSSFSRPAGGAPSATLLRTTGSASEKAVEAALAELEKYHLSAR
jgi:hypothetical protein